MLRVALLSGGGRRLRVIAEKLAEKAEQGDLQAIQQIADRLDGRPAQAIECGDLPLEAMTDQQLMAIARTGPREPLIEPALIAGLFRTPNERRGIWGLIWGLRRTLDQIAESGQ